MTDLTFYEGAARDSGAGYTATSQGTLGSFGMIFSAGGGDVTKLHVYLPTGTDLSKALAYVGLLFEYTDNTMSATTLRAHKSLTNPAIGWNTITLDASISDSGKLFLFAMYEPEPSYVYKHFQYSSEVQDATQSLTAPASSTISALTGSYGNGVFDMSTDMTTFPNGGSWSTFDDSDYGLDVTVALTVTATAPANTVAPHITPTTAHTGDVLTCSDGTWTGSPTPAKTKQWKRDGVNIAGATGNTYTCQVADQGHAITCTVTTTNSQGSASATSDDSVTPTAVPPGAPSNTAAPSISPSTGVHTGDVLNVSAGTWTNSPTGYSFQLQRDSGSGFTNVDSPISDADGAITYTTVSADEGHPIRFVVTATNGTGSTSANSNSVTSSAVIVTPPPVAGSGAILLVEDPTSPGNWIQLNIAGPGSALRVLNEASVRPEDFQDTYGALGQGEDSATLEGCVFEAVRAALDNGTNYTEIMWDPTRGYEFTRNALPGGEIAGLPRLGFSQMAFPALAPEDYPKVVVKIHGGGAASIMHWAQTMPLSFGTMIKSTQETVANDATYGRASVIGTPTVPVGSNPLAPYFTNLLVDLDGFTVQCPFDQSVIPIDLRGAGQARVGMNQGLQCTFADKTVTDLNNTPASNPNNIALYMPSPGNNAVCDVGTFSSQGYYYGFGFSEHTVAKRLLILHGHTPLLYVGDRQGRASTGHMSTIEMLTAEAVQVVLEVIGASPLALKLTADLELTGSPAHNLLDSDDLLHGTLWWNDTFGTAPNPDSMANMEIINLKEPLAG